MFKLISLKLDKHPQLGTIDLQFVDSNEIYTAEKPYTTVIIGANGTGKSYILRTIAEIFRIFNEQKNGGERRVDLQFGFQLRYLFDDSIYDIVDSRWISHGRKGDERFYHFLKDRPLAKEIFDSTKKLEFSPTTGYEISIDQLMLPKKVIVSSIMLNDRFIFAESFPTDFYQYLGVRRTSGMTSTRSFQRKTIMHLFEAAKSKTFKSDLARLLSFLGFKEYFKIHYSTKYNSLFLSDNLTVEEFTKFYENWWNSTYTKRKKENPLWGKSYYDNLKKDQPARINELITYLASIRGDSKRIINGRARSKVLEIDLFEENSNPNEYDLIEDLEKLDVLNVIGIKLKKKNSELSLADASSGEYHLVMSLLGLYSKMESSSIILVDEPEISLHPNWQMRYVDFLKRMFSGFSDCHFVIASHSHFLISDLEGKNSSVLALTREIETNALTAELLEGIDTYGWSAEDVLYNVFNVASTRNKFVAEDIAKILDDLSSGDQNKINKLTQDKYNQIVELEAALKENDPLKTVIRSILTKVSN